LQKKDKKDGQRKAGKEDKEDGQREEKSRENRSKKKKEINVFSIQDQYVQRL